MLPGTEDILTSSLTGVDLITASLGRLAIMRSLLNLFRIVSATIQITAFSFCRSAILPGYYRPAQPLLLPFATSAEVSAAVGYTLCIGH